MKPRHDITPYTNSTDRNVNASISLLKIYKRLRDVDATYKPSSRFQARLKNKQAARQVKLHIVR